MERTLYAQSFAKKQQAALDETRPPRVGGSSRLADIPPNRSKLSKNFCPKRGSSSSEADALENMEWRPPPSGRGVYGRGLVGELGVARLTKYRLVCTLGTGNTRNFIPAPPPHTSKHSLSDCGQGLF